MQTGKDKRRKHAIYLIVIALVAAVVLSISLAIRDQKDKNALFSAAGVGELKKVQSLVNRGVQINEASSKHFGWTPLICAVYHNKANVVRYLLEAGADANMADKNGKTPLMWATVNGDEGVDALKELIAHGADLHAKDKSGETVFGYVKSTPAKPRLVEVLEATSLEQAR